VKSDYKTSLWSYHLFRILEIPGSTIGTNASLEPPNEILGQYFTINYYRLLPYPYKFIILSYFLFSII
jgi:hypothetical protein